MKKFENYFRVDASLQTKTTEENKNPKCLDINDTQSSVKCLDFVSEFGLPI